MLRLVRNTIIEKKEEIIQCCSTHSVVGAVFVLKLCTVDDALALSQIGSVHNETYDITITTCAYCHDNGVPSETSLGVYGKSVQSAGFVFPEQVTSSELDNRERLAEIIAKIEHEYVSKIVGSQDITATSDQDLISVTFVQEKRRGVASAPTGVASVVPPDPKQGITYSVTGPASATINIGGLSQLERGNLRRNAPSGAAHLTFEFTPVNEDFFKPTTQASKELNQLRVYFQNVPPVATNDEYEISGALSTFSANVFDKGVDIDIDGDEFRAEIFSEPSIGTVSLNADGTFTYELPAPSSVVQEATFTYRLFDKLDSSITSNLAEVKITISPGVSGNDNPVAIDDIFQVFEDTEISDNVITPSGGQDPDTDPNVADLSNLEVSVVSNPRFGTITLSSDGNFTYTPNENSVGDDDLRDEFTYLLKDPSDATDIGKVIFNFVPENDPPVVTPTRLTAVNESQSVTTIDLLSSVFVNDVDNDFAELSIKELSFTLSDESIISLADITPIIEGNKVKIDPSDFQELGSSDRVDLSINYRVSDGAIDSSLNTVTLPVIGLDEDIGRVAGQYATTLASRYDRHFLTAAVQNDACHACHKLGKVSVEVRTVDQCSADVFNPFGLELCLNRDTSDPPLVDLVRRLGDAETEFAPKLDSAPSLEVEEIASVGTPVGAPLTANGDPGKTVSGTVASIHGFGFARPSSPSNFLQDTDLTGQFRVAANGQISVAGTLTPGVYVLDVRPINDAGQIDNAGNVVPGKPGFFPLRSDLLRFVTINVKTVLAQPNDDTYNVAQDERTALNVVANDGPGSRTAIAIKSNPTNGTATIKGDEIEYTPNVGFVGTDTISYASVNNGVESAAIATVTVTVIARGGAIAIDDDVTAIRNQETSINVTENDLGNRPFTVSLESTPSDGTVSVSGTSISYTPPLGFVGTASFDYRLTNSIASTTATVSVSVANVDGSFLANGTSDPELKRVARAMGDSCQIIAQNGGPTNDNQQDLVNICENLADDVAAATDISDPLSSIRNEELLAAGEQLLSQGRQAGFAILDRISLAANGGGRGVNVSDVALSLGEERFPSEVLSAFERALIGTNGGKSGSQNPGWGLFALGSINFGEREEAQTPGYDFQSANITGGVDYLWKNGTLIGGAFTYSRLESDSNSSESDLDSQAFQLSLFGSTRIGKKSRFRFDGVVSYGITNFESNRAISFVTGGSNINRTASADFSGQHVNVVPRVVFDIAKVSNLHLSGFGTVNYLYAHIDDYQETGAGGLSLRVNQQNINSLTGSVGVNATARIDTVFGAITPRAKVGLNSEFVNSGMGLTASFAALDAFSAPTFFVDAEDSDSLFVDLELGATASFGKGQLDFSYATALDYRNFTFHRFQTGFQFQPFRSDTFNLNFSADAGAEGEFDAMGMQARYRRRF